MPRSTSLLYILCIMEILHSTLHAQSSTETSTDMIFTVRMEIDLGQDQGQNFGTLFEATDAEGRVIAGAGYQSTYNTESRIDRRLLQFYVRPRNRTHTIERLPRVNNDAGVYLHGFQDRVFAKSRGGKDRNLYAWNKDNKSWEPDETTAPFNLDVGQGILSVTSKQVSFNGNPILTLDRGSIGPSYYANGFFIFRHYDTESDPPLNNLVACPWTPDSNKPIDLAAGHTLDMRTPGEFVYACGQLAKDNIITTNTGGVYRFNGKQWDVLLEPDMNTSFQVYCAVNYYNRLLLGQYPTGEFFEYDGENLTLLKSWPPVMEGVSTHAREAQTTVIYGGDLYIGVWPWAELWRYDHTEWSFTGRFFPHPEITRETTHPYENETSALGEILNNWGQRITSLVPYNGDLFLSTSSKGGTPYEPKFTFLANGKWKDYGAIYRIHIPGHLSAHTRWTNGPTTFEFTLTNNELQVTQDGKSIGSVSIDPTLAAEISPQDITWGSGVFGTFQGEILDKSLNR